ncbi:MAG: UvrD-helicase domain-containing protein, partial [Eubacterium sp.]
MGVKWTTKQQKIINQREKNILVSAAAGSGKTAVLVEHIMSMITDDKHPVDIDKLLIVTFTKAAASEMRERILNEIEIRAEAEPDNERLKLQQSYIHNAHINTIDGFCLNIIKENFDKINVDPEFKIGEDGELKLLRSDVISEMLEDYYSKGDIQFIDFVNEYSGKKSDDNLESLIIRLYDFAMSYPNPEQWLLSCKEPYSIDTADDLYVSSWYKYIEDYVNETILECNRIIHSALEICDSEEGPYYYRSALEDDQILLRNISEASFDKRYSLFSEMKFKALYPKKDSNVDENKKNSIKIMREKVKGMLNNIKADFYFQNLEDMLYDIKNASSSVNMLIDLTIDFMHRFLEAKAERKILDFSDLEHFALDILIQKNEKGEPLQSEIAKEIAAGFTEILVDEYQDINNVQDTLIRSISGGNGHNNIFMVGDVKQSIYKFRLASPELFIQKYKDYDLDDSAENWKISLDQNFRSRENIIESINFIFRQLMHKDICGIDYDKDSELKLGAQYERPELPGNNDTEFIIVEQQKGEEAIRIEAAKIAERIKELVNVDTGLKVRGKDGNLRTARYSDIVILLRS